MRAALVSSGRAAALAAAAAQLALTAADDGLNQGFAAEHVPSAIVIGQLVALLRFGLALVANPLDYRTLRDYVAEPPVWTPGPVPGAPHELGRDLVGWGFSPAVSLRDHPGENASVFDVYQAPGSVITAAVSRATGSLSLLSRLADGRIAMTAALHALPNESLVVNTKPGAEPASLIDAHGDLLAELASRGVNTVPGTPRAWIEAAELEHAGYRALGPVLGSLCNLMGSAGGGRLLLRMHADALLAVAMPPERGIDDSAGQLTYEPA